MENRRIILAITGATGAGFGVAVARRLAANPLVGQVSLLLSPTGRRCLADECGLRVEELTALSPKLRHLDERNVGADIASGSHRQDGMAVVPCSAGTLGRIASGVSDGLVTRAADVCLKERRPLVLCLRETPLNRIHLENMLRVHDAGAVVMPIMPGFYHRPDTLDDLFQAFATRVLDQLGLPEADARRWGG
ncbi:UbiX family flavin prenyltransferase [Mesoterricola silvestris]|uniref:Flavin prenyltransferase UbiX n=1 Tax=Mesoterricola silvestris TaxID=2927979 RepID=A0AA48K833_9BACT|nr:UbiX family flavin prenyltransferase [Mesoterricola silvestris]BDU71811.1 flavin prenyltransferase UbiX [Mesoterricola silvestris]